jgi:HAD superfamily hydrolase (TIGR01549 family)
MIRNLICDVDGTLLECGKYYVDAQAEFAKYQSERVNLPYALCLNLFKKVDVECTVLPDAFSAERFPRSFAAVSALLDVLANKAVIDDDAMNKSYEIGESVFYAEYPLYNGVRETLQAYKDAGFRLFVLTKGQDWVQQRKLDINELNEFFPAENVYIVLNKTGDCIRQIMQEHGLTADDTIMIGDSERDDIGAANNAGISSVLVSTGHKWGYETGHEQRPTAHVASFDKLPTVIPYA